MTHPERPVTRSVPPSGPSLHDVRAAVTGLRDLRQEIAAREGDESELTDAQVKSLLEAGRRCSTPSPLTPPETTEPSAAATRAHAEFPGKEAAWPSTRP